ILEGAQAGLSWSTILNKRDRYREVFDRFDPQAVAAYNTAKIESLLQDPGIVRNRRKVEAAITNARAFLTVKQEFGTFNRYIWGFVGGRPIQNAWASIEEIPAESSESVAMSKALKKRGFKFVAPTISYVFMQAVGMVNDHTIDCFRYRQLAKEER
ncbi:DNA-3-methyladenine glycosylase I, partial [Candidatus Bipolaricaulota bacterium]|nr:DNA-3-methyladenine glycosylase I [Candidatus Bipolaricaulota bacterium]